MPLLLVCLIPYNFLFINFILLGRKRTNESNDIFIFFFHRDVDIISKYLRLLSSTNCSKLAAHDLTVEEQVEGLIDIATSPVILGSAYSGARQWI